MEDDTPISSSNVSKARILTQNDGAPRSKFEQDPENYTNTQLKRWLKCRALKSSGKRADLISRVSDGLKSGNHYVLDLSIDEGKWLQAKILKESNINRIHLKDLTVPQTPKSGWRVFPSQDIPSLFNYGHVYHYTLESLPVIEENIDNTEDEENPQDTGLGHMTDKPFIVGRKYIDSGFVHDLSDNKTNEHYFVRAHVWPSMQSDFPHNVNITLSRKSGAVIHASCSPCKMLELGRCSHVVAVLLTLVDCVNNHGEWLHSRTTTCQRKFSSKPSSDIPCQSDQTQNCDGTKSISWHCAGIRTTYQCRFHCFKNFAIFSVDLLSRRCKLQISDLPASIILNGQQLTLHSGTL